jgi:hypothetical protein
LTQQQGQANQNNNNNQSPIFTDSNNNQWLLLPPGIQQVLDENGQLLEIVTIDDGRGNLIGAVPATPGNFQTLQRQNMLNVNAFGNNNNNNNQPPESTLTIVLRVVKRLAILVIVIYLTNRLWKWYRSPKIIKNAGNKIMKPAPTSSSLHLPPSHPSWNF